MDEQHGIVKARREAFSGRVFGVSTDRVVLPHGRELDLDVVRHPESVVLLAMPDPSRLILVKQYRYAVDQWVWELPAGSVDKGETAEQGARRECEEEIELVPDRIERVGHFYPTPGYCDEKMIFFRLTGLRPPPADAPAAHKDPDEDLRVRTFTIDELRGMLRAGELPDLKTAVALTLLR